ncbi:MAG: sel1 repeat family protein [Verrucomicrobia bacterium]|nr:MAG: sel1 repeat family protein [Verrucomicrobiota bacterium]
MLAMVTANLEPLSLLVISLALVSGGCSRGPSTQTALEARADAAATANFDQTKQKAEQGDAIAQNLLGQLYLQGQGTRQDPKAAAEWFKKSAEQGHGDGQFNLGTLFEAGQGVVLDYTWAAEWYRKAAEQGHTAAQYSLAAMYVYARGVERNDAEALKWLGKAAQQGDALAQYAMGERHKTGTGVPRDLIEAFKWFTLAAAQKVVDAATALDEIQSRMTRDQIAEGRKRAEQFGQQHPSGNTAKSRSSAARSDR